MSYRRLGPIRERSSDPRYYDAELAALEQASAQTLPWGPPTDVASGVVTDLSRVATILVNITGSTSITRFSPLGQDPRPGAFHILRFNAALGISANPGVIDTPTGSGISITSGDSILLANEGGSGWRVWGFFNV